MATLKYHLTIIFLSTYGALLYTKFEDNPVSPEGFKTLNVPTKTRLKCI